jgi:hypothetical protein
MGKRSCHGYEIIPEMIMVTFDDSATLEVTNVPSQGHADYGFVMVAFEDGRQLQICYRGSCAGSARF